METQQQQVTSEEREQKLKMKEALKEKIISQMQNSEKLEDSKDDNLIEDNQNSQKNNDQQIDQKDEEENSKKEKKDKKKNKSRSKSRDKKHRSKKSRSRRKSRSRDRSGSRRKKKRSRSHRRSRSRSYRRSRSNRRRHRSRSRSRKDRKRSKTPKKSRTRSPVKIIKRYASPPRGQGGEGQKYWDGFQWVQRSNARSGVNDQEIMNQTRKLRRIQVTNLPIYLGLTQDDVQQILTKFILDNYLNDYGNSVPVVSCLLAQQSNSAIIEVSSVEETNRLVKLEHINLYNEKCKVIRMADTSNITLASMNSQQNTQQAAQAQAAAMAAIEMMQSKDGATSFQLGYSITPPSVIIKISNIVTQDKIPHLTENMFNDIKEDIDGEISNYGKVICSFIVKPYQIAIGAQAGCVFVEYTKEEEAIQAYENINGRIYASNELKVHYIHIDVYNKNFKELQFLKRILPKKN